MRDGVNCWRIALALVDLRRENPVSRAQCVFTTAQRGLGGVDVRVVADGLGKDGI
jgi:hypothetical protein